MPHTDHTLQLSDGRTLGYAEFGVPDGRPVLYFHGAPGSRLDVGMLDQALIARLGLRVIAPDRPGIGLSSFTGRRTIKSTCADAAALADRLGLARVVVLSVSCGGPYALGFAHAYPERVSEAMVVSSVAPFAAPGVKEGMGPGRLFFDLAGLSPWLAGVMVGLMRSGLGKPDQFMAQVAASMPEADKRALERPNVRQAFYESMRQALAPGWRGLAWDAALAARPWGFRLEEIAVPIHLWHGEADTNAPPAMGRYLAQRIPDCRAHFCPGEGHLSLPVGYAEQYLQLEDA